jgi:pSer/pThr/pTyr-binding forkhead associated (FHA) protein
MDAKLVVTSGAKPAKIALRLPTVIGRSAEAQLKVKQHNVSRRHCEIFEADGQLMIRDLGSSNGTVINGERIEGDFALSPGDELTLGTVQLCVVFQPSSGTNAAAKAVETKRVAASEPETTARHQAHALDAEAQNDEAVEQVRLGGSAVLNYEDLEDGSFIAIALHEPLPKPVESAVKLQIESAAQVDESRIQLEIDSADAAPIDDDSRLDDFLKGLGED